MNCFILSLQFLTILPLTSKHTPETKDTAGMLACFPAVGLVIGALLASLDILLSFFFPVPLANVFLTAFLALITGGLHLDGLADTFDGLGSGKEKMLAVMRDSRIGTMGVLSLIFVLLLKVALLSSVPRTLRLPVLLLMPTVSRWSMLVPLFLFRYAREEGKAKLCFKAMSRKILIATSVLVLAVSVLLLGAPGLVFVPVTGAGAFLFARIVDKRIGGITGDTLGAVNEINELVFLTTAVILAARYVL